MIRIMFNGTEQVVRSLEGYPDDVQVLDASITPPPSEFHEPNGSGGWRVNATLRDAAKRREMFQNMRRDELVDWILDKGKDVRDAVVSLNQRVAALEADVAALKAKVP